MQFHLRWLFLLLLVVIGLLAQAQNGTGQVKPDPLATDITQGALRVTGTTGIVECPLRHTDVQASISGFIARVKVTQTFVNPYNEKIEAVYVFPLPHTAAVDDMTMVVGNRRIVGLIKRRADARALYEYALEHGMTASLLEQERPNIFTQSVGNIKAKQTVKIEISYIDVLNYDMGTYEFHFPMVVGPRYIPGAPLSKIPAVTPELKGKVGTVPGATIGANPIGTGWAPDTNRVKDASRITPPVLKPGYRTGHDISLSVHLDAGVPIQDLRVTNHQANTSKNGSHVADVVLSAKDSIPNKDFVLKYNVLGEKPAMALLANSRGSGTGYFMLMVQPKIDKSLATAPPRELVFMVDVSGSMSGAPTEKNKAIMREFFKLSKPNDTMQVITFQSDSQKLFPKSVPVTDENVARALNFTQGLQGGGGTEMLKGIRMALDEPVDPKRMRIVIMLTDGFIGNEAQIIEEVGKRAGDQVRFWTLGIGSSPNRFLLDGVAKQGGGMSAVVELNTDPTEIVRNAVERMHRAQLAKIHIDWNGLDVYETYPRRIPELWAGRPVILFGRYFYGGKRTITISGTAEGKPLSYQLDVALPMGTYAPNEVLSKVWARQKIEDLSAQMYYGDDPAIVEEITILALDYHLMSQYTSLVAVDEADVDASATPVTPPRRMIVPVPLPDGVSYEGVFGASLDAKEKMDMPMKSAAMAFAKSPSSVMARSNMALSLARPQQVPAPQIVSGTSANSYSSMNAIAAHGIYVNGYAGAVNGRTFDSVESLQRRPETSIDATNKLATPIMQSLHTLSQSRHDEAKKALTEAQAMRKKGDLDGAFRRCQLALLLETAYLTANQGNNDGTSATATNELQQLQQAITQAREKNAPALAKKLKLVLGDLSIEQALRQIATASGMKITIIPGSIADAAELLNVTAPAVTYLDLRRATVTQALDWLLIPVHLSWNVDASGSITVGSARRLAGTSAWVYAIGDLAIPEEKEFGTADQQKKVDNALQDFIAGIRLITGQKGQDGLTPGAALFIDATRLLVYAEPATHTQVQTLLTLLQQSTGIEKAQANHNLSVPEWQRLRQLQQRTSTRWTARTAERGKRLAIYERQRITEALETFSWKLLAAAYHNEIDQEALTELRIAWKNPRLAEVLAGPNGWLVLRSAWCISTASGMQTNEELTLLVKTASAIARQQQPVALKALDKTPNDMAAYISLLYTALCLHDSSDATLQALRKPGKDSPLFAARAVATTLLAPGTESDTALLNAISEQKLVGDDLILLANIAAKQRGGAVWQTCREQMPDLIKAQPLSGDVVVIANRIPMYHPGKLTTTVASGITGWPLFSGLLLILLIVSSFGTIYLKKRRHTNKKS